MKRERIMLVVVAVFGLYLALVFTHPPALAQSPASVQAADVAMVGSGKLIDAFPLPGGAAVMVSYANLDGARWATFTYVQSDQTFELGRAMLPEAADPDMAMAGLCGKYVQFFANYTAGYTDATAPIYRATWELPVDSGQCAVRKLYLPWVKS